MKQSILATGLSGLLGTRIQELLGGQYEFSDLSFDTGIDITNKENVLQAFSQSNASVVLHLAAKTDVDGCEGDKNLKTDGAAWKINVGGTENIVAAAQKFGKRVVYISTDFVFNGRKAYYSEADLPDPVNWYGVTKYEAEKIVQVAAGSCIVRLAYPYMSKNTRKKDFLHAVATQLADGKKIQALSDHIFTPTFVDDIVMALSVLIKKQVTGIYHVAGSSSLTPFVAAQEICRTFEYQPKLITPVTIEDYYRGRAPRPYTLRLKNDKISTLGVSMKTFTQGLAEINKQGFKL